MPKFYPLKVAEVRRETGDSVSVRFEVPIDLKQDYAYIQGQYITLKLFSNGEEIRRSYSICSGVHENELRVAVKKVNQGKGSTFILDHLKEGDLVEVMTPMGNFHSPMHPDHKKHYVLFAGGSGITPVLSILKTVLKAEPKSKVTLFYGNLNEQATIFKNTLDQIQTEEGERARIYYIFEKPQNGHPDHLNGMLTREKVKELLDHYSIPNEQSEFFICGPGIMMDNVRDTLEERNIPKANIHVEYFSAGPAKPNADASTLPNVISKVTMVQYGMETSFELATNGKAILDAATEAGVDAPFSCKGAVCATCRGKIVEGTVYMEKNFALTDQEVKDGFILTCQSHPTSAVLKVDYDC